MKIIFLCALLVVSVGAAWAQSIAAGTISLGGGIGYNRSFQKSEFAGGNNTFTNESTQSEFKFSPAVGYFIADNLAVGLNMSYAAARTTTTLTGPGRTSPTALDAATSLRVGPYVQYYKMVSEQFGVLGTLGAGYQNTFYPFNGGNNSVIEVKRRGFYANLTPGVIFFPVSKFGITASIGNLGYDQASMTRNNDPDNEDSETSTFGASFGFSQLLFGGTFFLGR